MRISELCIKRPVLTIVMSLAIVLLGILSFTHLETRYFPDVIPHVVVIEIDYPSASARLVESLVNAPIEDAVSSISGIDTLTSNAKEGVGNVVITFQPNVNFNEKTGEVRDALGAIRSQLPADIDQPVVKIDKDSNFLMSIAISDPNMQPAKIRDYAINYLADKFQEITGIANLGIWGSNKYAMRIWLNSEKMAAHKITVDDVRTALEKNNIRLPAGKLESETMSFPVTEDTILRSASEFNDLAVTKRDGAIIRIRDIGYAKLGLEGDPFYARLNGKSVIGLSIYLQANANPMMVSATVHRRIANIQSTLPVGMKLQVPEDFSHWFKEALTEVYRTIFLALICVIAVMFLFLGSLRAVIIPVVTIPICIVGSFAVMALFGFSINLMTLLAIVLSIGLVVDDAIVVQENVFRGIEAGLQPYEAAIAGSKEIAFPVLAMTITLAAVYLPIGFLDTSTAIVFREFAFTLAGAVIISGFLALTLSPAMCAWMMRSVTIENSYVIKLEQFFNWLKNSYQKLLKKITLHKIMLLIICIAVILGGIFLLNSLPKMVLPPEDTGIVLGNFSTPTNSNYVYTLGFLKKIEQLCSKDTDIAANYVFAMDNSMNLFLTLKPVTKRTSSAEKISARLNQQVDNIPGISGYFNPLVISYGGHGADLELQIITTENYTKLFNKVQAVINELHKYSALSHIENSMKFDSQQYDVTINRKLADSIGVTTDNIDNTLSVLLGGTHITDFYMGNNSYQVIVQADKKAISTPTLMNKFYVKNLVGDMVSLANMATLKPVLSQVSLAHYDKLRSAEITAQLKPGFHLSEVISFLQHKLPGWLGNNYKYAFTGKTKLVLENTGNMSFIFILALIFIYLVLAALFESFIDPLVVLLVVPLSLIGGLLLLYLTDSSLNLYSDIALVTLVGLIAKHGILITHFANKLRADGMSAKEAAIKAASIRLRPILMTTSAMVLGALPLLFTLGIGANSQAQTGYVIIGGLLLGTFFSLGVVPVAYIFLARFNRKKYEK